MLLAMGGSSANTVPTVSGASASTFNIGTCPTVGSTPTQAAVVRVSWSIMNPDTSNYTTSVFKDGTAIATGLSNSSTTYDYTVSGYVDSTAAREGTPEINPSWVFRVDVIKTSDSTTASTTTAPTYTNTFGTCNGPH